MTFAHPTNPYLSPHYRLGDWRGLEVDSDGSGDWALATKIIEDRIRGRILAPIQALEENVDSRVTEFCGFAVLALDCLLIETLSQFYKGRDATPPRQAKNAFWDFFRESEFFRDEFDSKEKSDIFYEHIRCGILHQAQTQRRSAVIYGRSSMLELRDKSNVSEGLIVDRKRFHCGLEMEFQAYLVELRDGADSRSAVRRENCRKKMQWVVAAYEAV